MADWPLDNIKTQNQRYQPRNLSRPSTYVSRAGTIPPDNKVQSQTVTPVVNVTKSVVVADTNPVLKDTFDEATETIINQQIVAPIYLNNYSGEYEDNKYRKYSLKALGITKKLAFGSSLAISILLAGAFLYFMSWNTSKGVVHAEPSSVTGNTSFNLSNKPLYNGQPASTVEPTINQINSYSVAASSPKYLIIPKLNISSMITPVDVNGNYLNAPDDIYNVGWWRESSLPGQTGAVVLDGFTNNGASGGVFAQVGRLKPGDSFKVERGDGSMVSYNVIKTQAFSSNSLTMEQAISPLNQNQPSLNIITCSGQTNTCPNSEADTVIFTAQQ